MIKLNSGSPPLTGRNDETNKVSFDLMRLSPRIKYLSVFALALSMQAQAAEWWATPDIILESGYNDNIRLTSAPHDSVWETDLSLSSGFGVSKENQGVTGNAAVKIRRFAGGSGAESSDLLDREDYFLSTDTYHQTELSIFRGNVGYIQDSTLDSELDQSGLVDDQRATRVSKTLGASWARTLTEKMEMNLGYEYSNIDYIDDPGINDLVAYKTNVFSASMGYQYTPRTQVTLAASRSSFKPSTSINSDTLNIQAGITHSFSETLSMTLLAGQRNTTSDALFASGFCIGADPGASFPECTGGNRVVTGSEKGETTTSGPTYNANITKAFETGTLTAALTRSTSPGLNGELLDRNSLILLGDRKFTERLSSTVRIEYSENQTIVNALGREPDNVTEKFYRFRHTISWRWLSEWTIGGSYQYARNKDRQEQTATRNAVYLTLSYQPTKLSISR